MINAVTNSTVPHITVNIGASFGAGNYGMSGRAYDPRFMFAWPNAKLAVMGAAAAGRGAVDRRPPGRRGRRAAVRRRRGRQRRRQAIEEQIERESHAFFVTARLLRRRDHRPARHPDRARHRAVRGALRRRSRAAAASASSGCEAPRMSTPSAKLLVANRGEIAARIDPHRPRAWTSPRWRCSPTPMPRLPYVAPGRRGGARCPGNAPADTYLNVAGLSSPRPSAPVRTPSTPGYGFLSENAGVRPGLRRRRADLRRAAAGGHRGHGLQDRGQGADERLRACPVLPGGDCRGRRASSRSGQRRGRDRLPAAGQGGVRRRRPGHAGGRARDEAWQAALAGPAGRRRPPSATAPCSCERYVDVAAAHRGADLRRRATATWCTCSSGSARSSAATRRSSRRRRPRPWTTALRTMTG